MKKKHGNGLEKLTWKLKQNPCCVNYVKHKIDKTAQSPRCRMYNKKSETTSHIVSECEKLAQKLE